MRTRWICTIGLLSTTCYGAMLPKATLKESDAIAVTACEVARVETVSGNPAALTDVHGIGGDPGDGADLKKQNQSQPKDIYGYAALGDTKGIIMLRNPSNQTQTISGTIDQWLEMPSARQGLRVNPTVVFNSTTAYENAGQSGAFSPTWPTTAETLNWPLPPFTTFLFEVNSKPGYRLLLR